MKVLALNGSPRGKNSSTHQLLTTLMEGMTLAGAECELVNLSRANVSPCTGCFSCWTATPEECIIRDGMDTLLKTYVESDLVIYGTPLHTYMASSLLKQFIDRCFPLHTATMVNDSNNVISSLVTRYENPRKILLVSNCGFPEYDHFQSLTLYFEHMAKMMGKEYLGAILQPMGEILKKQDAQTHLIPYYNLLRKIGKTIIENGALESAQLIRLKEKWIIQNSKDYQDFANDYYKIKQEKFKHK